MRKIQCNVQYDRTILHAKDKLRRNIGRLFYNLINKDKSLEEVIQTFLDIYFPEYNNTKYSLKDLEDPNIKMFVEDLIEIIENTSGTSEQQQLEFKTAILTAFLDESSIQAVSLSQDNSMEVQEITVLPIEEVSNEIFGPINVTLRQYATGQFYKELRNLLVINASTAEVYNHNITKTNSIINKYKQSKFNSILSLLKDKYKQDSKLQNITGMYKSGNFDLENYSYVMNLFKQYLSTISELNSKLLREHDDIIQMKHQKETETIYKNFIAYLLEDDNFRKWFNNRFTNDTSRNQAQSQLYIKNDFSSYYHIIVDKLNKEFDKESWLHLKSRSEEFIHQLNHSGTVTLDYVNDYFILNQFDHLISTSFNEYIKINKNYLIGSEPSKQNNTKYEVVKVKKHQKSGWNTLNDEGSEKHTSTTVKNLLETIYIYDYNNPSVVIPQTLTLAALNQAWQSFISDILFNGAKFRSATDSTSKLKSAILSMQDDTAGSVKEIFDILFSSPSGQRLASSLTSTKEFTNNHLNILYSYYIQVIQNDDSNKESFAAKETNPKNNRRPQYTNFLNITTDLIAILHRNVNNKYLDCDVRTGEITVKSTFNVDSDFFKVLDRIQGTIRKAQENARNNKNVLEQYKFESTQDYIGITINGSDESYNLGYNLRNQPNGIFTEGGLQVESDKIGEKSVLAVLANLDLVEFKIAFLQGTQLNNNQTLLKNLLEFIQEQLGYRLLTEIGLDTLIHYKSYGSEGNYLNHLLHLSLKSLEAIDQNIKAQDQNKTLLEYLKSDSKYNAMYKNSEAQPKQTKFMFQGKVYFNITHPKDTKLYNLVKSEKIIKGEASKSTSRTKQGATVSNYSISRAGSTLCFRLDQQRKSPGSAASKLLFVKEEDLLNPDPVNDQEFTTPTGDVKDVSECVPAELIQHAIVDKFYISYLNSKKIIFQPTVYSDKVQFLNYIASLTVLGNNPLNISNNLISKYEKLYRETFFAAHSAILGNVITKFKKLMDFKQFKYQQSNIVNDINTFLKGYNKETLLQLLMEYNENNPTEVIALELDKDYRYNNGACRLNEVLVHYSRMHDDPNRISEFLNQQLKQFVSDLQYYGVVFNVFNSSSDLNKWIGGNSNSKYYKNPWIRILSSNDIIQQNENSKRKFANKWIDSQGNLKIQDENGEVNPLLKNFFYIEGLYSNNLRLSLTGSEINHPDKASDVLWNTIQELINQDTQEAKEALKSIFIESGLYDDSISEQELIDLIDSLKDVDIYNLYQKNPTTNQQKLFNYIYNTSIINIINTEQGTQYKRNVIVTATSQKLVTGLTDGSASEVNVCIIGDIDAPVNNLRYSKKIDSQDGSARMSPIQVILENNSLGDQAVGINRKPIWDSQTPELTSFLAKFAAFGITNAEMLETKGSKASLYNLFKKMHSEHWEDNEINLTHNIFNNTEKSDINTNYDTEHLFQQYILEGKKLYYKNALDQIVQIQGFGKDDKGYFTKESINGSTFKVYHYFDDDSNHYTTYQNGLHNISSLFELFTAMGGIYCVDSQGNQSEFSLQVLTNFVINVGYHKHGNQDKYLAKNVYQPLKNKFIAYAFNSTAVKNGAMNVNPKERWSDNKKLATFKLSVKGLGIQLNADHDVVKSQMTEFSQVIAACAAYGKYFNSTNELYYSLGQFAAEASYKELQNVENYLTGKFKDPQKAKYDLYKLIGKLLIQQHSNNNNDLTDQIKLYVNQILKTDKDYAGKELKIPFSDMSLYQQFITSITSVINNKSIKRKHPGLGYVMAPSYDTIQYYRLPVKGEYREYLYSDIVNKAKLDFKGELYDLIKSSGVDTSKYSALTLSLWSFEHCLNFCIKNNLLNSSYLTEQSVILINDGKYSIPDTANFNDHLLKVYLNKKQSKEKFRPKEWFMPTDIVLVTHADGSSQELDLSDMADYQAFMDKEFKLTDKFQLCVTKPNNLKPSLIRWRYNYNYAINENLISESDTYDKPWSTPDKNGDFPTNKAMRFYINRDDREIPNEQKKGFELVKDHEENYWSIHFKTLSKGEVFDKENPPITQEEKIELFKAIANKIPVGDKLSTWGSLTPGGIQGLTNLAQFGFEQIGTRQVKDASGNDIQIPIYEKVGRYMNIYSHPIIKNSWNKDIEQRPTQAQIQKVLDLLEQGEFNIGDIKYSVIKGSLENTEAEIVLGNMYKEEFGVGNRTLASILDQGKTFFDRDTEIKEIPKGFYHLAFVDPSDNHVLISLDKNITTTDDVPLAKSLIQAPWELEKFEHNVDSNEIYVDGLKIGKYIENPTWKVASINNVDQVVDNTDTIVDNDKYKLIERDGKKVVLERIDYIYRYKYEYAKIINGESQVTPYTLYKVADVKEVARSFNPDFYILDSKVNSNNATAEEKTKYFNLLHDANNQIATVLEHIYDKGKFEDIRINSAHPNIQRDLKLRQRLSNILSKYGSLEEVVMQDGKKSTVINKMEDLDNFEQYIVKVRELLEGDFEYSKYKNLVTAHYAQLNTSTKKFTSFLNSLYFISSRIPAQSLQSFMPMRCVGWTRDTNNTAYVSYIQTFLQGSDYDIDKAYIMGQSFKGGIYVGWSNLFDYSSNKTLQASKKLPVPKKIKLKQSNNTKYNIDEQLNKIHKETDRATKIELIADLIFTLERNKGFYNCDDTEQNKKLIRKIQKHENYKIGRDVKEMAYKNVASANIFNIVHGIRNRDQAYSDITLKDLSKLAENSPKGKRTKSLNTMNPMSKYVMQYQNLVGKNVIGIAANGEKVWFNLTYWYHNILNFGNEKDKTYIQVSHKYDRIQGRSANDIKLRAFKYIPDIANVNTQLTQKLKEAFALEDNFGESDEYVDQKISQLLSAATDNAKELILAKINAGSKLAKYHLHLMMLGFSLDDIVSFMTSTAIELVDKYSSSDVYNMSIVKDYEAINMLKGIFSLEKVKQNVIEYDPEDLGDMFDDFDDAFDFDFEEGYIENDSYSWVTDQFSKAFKDSGATSFKQFIEYYFRAKINYYNEFDNKFDKLDDNLIGKIKTLENWNFARGNNYSLNRLFAQVDKVIQDINTEMGKIQIDQREEALISMYKDLQQYKDLQGEVNETTSFATSWLKSNQGIPQTDEELIAYIKKLKDSVSFREKDLSIKKLIPTTSKFKFLQLDTTSGEDSKSKYLSLFEILTDEETGKRRLVIIKKDSSEFKYLTKVIGKIKSNNPALSVDYILSVLYDSIKYDIFGNFNLLSFLGDEKIKIKPDDTLVHYNTRRGDSVSYRELAADYYNLIKANWNILDVVTRSPIYKLNLDLINYTLTVRDVFSVKAQILNELTELPEIKGKKLSTKQYKQILSYVNQLMVIQRMLNNNIPINISKIPESRIYNHHYDLVEANHITLNTLNGMDSLKYWVENFFLPWLNKEYPNNKLVEDLYIAQDHGKDVIRTVQDLTQIDFSIQSKATFNAYLVEMEKFSTIQFDDKYTIADILALYNLVVNGTKLGNNLTPLFKNIIKPGSQLYEYYYNLGESDWNGNTTYLVPTKEDFLIYIAPIVYSEGGLQLRTEQYVKRKHPMRGFIIYKRKGSGYEELDRDKTLSFIYEPGITKQQIAERELNYSNTVNLFPSLYGISRDAIWDQLDEDTKIADLVRFMEDYIRDGKLLAVKIC